MEPKRTEEKTDRRQSNEGASIWAEVVGQNAWRPQDKPRFQTDGWLRQNGYLPDRRTQK